MRPLPHPITPSDTTESETLIQAPSLKKDRPTPLLSSPPGLRLQRDLELKGSNDGGFVRGVVGVRGRGEGKKEGRRKDI